jgi:dTDP-4-dehydrorhamnose 3,5-epimerase
MAELIKTEFRDLYLVQPRVFGDARGYFFESFSERNFLKAGHQYRFVQDNESFSRYGTLRGLHFQRGEFAQTKLLRVIQGYILDVVVDLRPQESTFQKIYSVELSGENRLQILVPRGFAHGFVVLSETATVVYKCDNFYSPENEGGINPESVDLNIDWRVPKEKRIISEKDRRLPQFGEVIATSAWEPK